MYRRRKYVNRKALNGMDEPEHFIISLGFDSVWDKFEGFNNEFRGCDFAQFIGVKGL